MNEVRRYAVEEAEASNAERKRSRELPKGSDPMVEDDKGKAGNGFDRAPILVPGETCWRLARADRLSVIVDAADYFRHLRAALRAAKKTIFLIGWDFDLRLEMLPDKGDADGNAPDGLPNRLGDFLQHLVTATPGLSLYILKWDKAMLVEIAQQAKETLDLKLASDRIQFALDSHHPVGATHHQKVVVVDDRLAFCGGIDVTGGRWDTRDHAPDDRRRHFPNGDGHKPWHDVTTALGGPIAEVLGDLARERWHAANGDELDPPRVPSQLWPDELDVDLEGVEVAVARTKPDYHEQPRVDEIEKLYLAAIRAARDVIYLESQYLASGTICEALERRLAEPGGPELLVINPDRAQGPVEHQVMDTARARMIERLRAAAARGGPEGRDRFRIYHPVNAGGDPIYVHAKVLIIDDRLVRIGSSNVNNRSMGFDTECDVAFETASADQRAFALAMRHDLLAEHLGCEPAQVASVAAEKGSLIAAVDALNEKAARRLKPIDPDPLGAVMRETGERILGDERTYPRNRPHPLKSLSHGAKRAIAPYHVEAVGAGALLLAVGAVAVGVWASMRYARRRAPRRPFPAPAVITPYPPRARPHDAPVRENVLLVEPRTGDAALVAAARARRTGH